MGCGASYQSGVAARRSGAALYEETPPVRLSRPSQGDHSLPLAAADDHSGIRFEKWANAKQFRTQPILLVFTKRDLFEET